MNILQIGTEIGWRGGENQLRLLCTGLSKQGVRNFIAVPQKSQSLKRLKANQDLIALPSANPLDMRSVFRICRVCLEENVVLINTHTGKAHSLGILVKKILPDIKLVVHRRVAFEPKKRFFSKRKYLSPLVDQYVAISHCIKQTLVNYGIPETKISVVHSAVDPSPYLHLNQSLARSKYIKKFNLPEDAFLIGNASALTEEKGNEDLIRAISRLNKQKINCYCLIAGTGKLKQELEGLGQTLGVEDRVLFLGFIDNIPEFLQALDVLAFPSRNEGLGSLLLEGLLAGCAIVASNVGGIPEIIQHEKNGLLCPPGSWEILADQITKLLQEKNQREFFYKNGLEHIEKHFSLSAMVNGNFNVYKALLGKC